MCTFSYQIPQLSGIQFIIQKFLADVLRKQIVCVFSCVCSLFSFFAVAVVVVGLYPLSSYSLGLCENKLWIVMREREREIP